MSKVDLGNKSNIEPLGNNFIVLESIQFFSIILYTTLHKLELILLEFFKMIIFSFILYIFYSNWVY